jgi:hypothetical protein
MLDKVYFTNFTSRSVITAKSSLAKMMSVKCAAWPRVCAVLCESSKQAENLSVQQDEGQPNTGITEILDTGASINEI